MTEESLSNARVNGQANGHNNALFNGGQCEGDGDGTERIAARFRVAQRERERPVQPSRWPLTPELEELNAVVRDHGNGRALFWEIERDYRRFFERNIAPCLPATCLRVHLAITARTLGWRKFSECIPYSHLTDGINAPDGSWMLDDRERPIFQGARVESRKAISEAIQALLRARLIDRVEMRRYGNQTYAYLPMSFRTLKVYMLATRPHGNRMISGAEVERLFAPFDAMVQEDSPHTAFRSERIVCGPLDGYAAPDDVPEPYPE